MTKFEEFAQEWRPQIDATIHSELERVMPAQENADLNEMMAYGLFSGGKRVRPLLTLAVWASFGLEIQKEWLKLASAIEWVHAYSLVHDDLPAMDNDLLRRGKPSLHAKFGYANAILTGDALLTGAFEVISSVKAVPAETLLEVTRDLSQAAGAAGMVGGQYHDMENHEDLDIDQSWLFQAIYEPKTAALITYSLTAAGRLLNMNRTDFQLLKQWGENFGLAFQVADDIDDYAQDEEENVKSLPQLVGMDKAVEVRDELFSRVKESLQALAERNQDFNPEYLAGFLAKLEQ
ncbi:polyprenyl synthetase family protein [Eupransor demetentiae]|uniref:Geranylgeranyl pyrophosphate synthase (IspA) n=1 Tax=Eupransor demetentiae TaxID=3109584 RepID=A0ABM9N3A9_9LACO|nr:Geranylgeranyl pyrophosphate synthase (IspA) [Lactobacillaceae bacterium LMG 33000]